jgi:hypothetical protein
MPTTITPNDEPGYPVIEAVELSPVATRRLRRPRRSLGEIPRQPPGTVLVFQVGEEYETQSGRGLHLDDSTVIDATGVVVVDMRRTVVQAEAQLVTSDPQIGVRLRARFDCLVTDPLLVVETGCFQVKPLLGDHLTRDDRVALMASRTDVSRYWLAFQRNMSARLRAFNDLNPYVSPGMTVRLMDLVIDLQRIVQPPAPRAAAETMDGDPRDYPADDDVFADASPEFQPDDYSWGSDDRG